MGVLTDARKQHRYQTCRDEDCERFACRVYREGYRDGHATAGRARKATPRATRHAGYEASRATTTATARHAAVTPPARPAAGTGERP